MESNNYYTLDLDDTVRRKTIIIEEKPNGCHECISHCNPDGYTRISFKGKTSKLSRVIYLLYNGYLPDDLVVRHTCDNPSCVNPEHLLLGTQQDNVDDCISRNRNTKGESQPTSKLTEEKVREIRKLKGQFTGYQVAKMYNMDYSVIYGIWRGEGWKHVI